MPTDRIKLQLENVMIPVATNQQLQIIASMIGRRKDDTLRIIVEDAYNRLATSETTNKLDRIKKNVQYTTPVPDEMLVPSFDSPDYLEQLQSETQQKESGEVAPKADLRPSARVDTEKLANFEKMEAEARAQADKGTPKAKEAGKKL